jgi:hypothetical protein
VPRGDDYSSLIKSARSAWDHFFSHGMSGVRLITHRLWPPSETAHSARHERNQEQHQRDEKHDLSDAYGRAGNAAESKNGSDQRDNQQRTTRLNICTLLLGVDLTTCKLATQFPRTPTGFRPDHSPAVSRKKQASFAEL